jgi:prepilin-type N-terminal cleavage/methylation domain-containing protein
MLKHKKGGFTLVEIMIVVAIIALLAAIAVPGFLRARKRSQGTTLKNDLRLIDAAKDQYAIEFNKTTESPLWTDLTAYFKPGTRLAAGNSDLFGRDYTVNPLNSLPGVNSVSYQGLSDVCDDTFWSPYPTS